MGWYLAWFAEKHVTFYLGKSRISLTQYHFSYADYATFCEPLLGYRPQFKSFEDLVALALAVEGTVSGMVRAIDAEVGRCAQLSPEQG